MEIRYCIKSLLLLPLVACSNIDLLHQAEDLTQRRRYDEAIATYRLHIEERLQDSSRLSWENPYFYLLRVGDIYLSQDMPQEALSAYIQAENEGIEKTLISDRLRSLASWYEQHNQLDKAFAILSEHRSRDPLLFDSMLDRISRALTKRENALLPGT